MNRKLLFESAGLNAAEIQTDLQVNLFVFHQSDYCVMCMYLVHPGQVLV